MDRDHPTAGRRKSFARGLAKALLAALVVSVALLGARGQAHAAEANQACSPSAQFQFLCGFSNPEDIVVLPSTSWMLVSGWKKGGGITAVDGRNNRMVSLAGHMSIRPDAKTYPGCAAPDAAALWTHGLYARAAGKKRYKVYAVGHFPEAVHVFDLKLGAADPKLTWIGCVAPPAGATNSVAALRDGTILTTVFTFPGLTMGNMEVGQDTGAVYRWRPGDKAFVEIPGTRLPGNNGIDLSADEKTMFVVAGGLRAVVAYSYGEQVARLWTAPMPIVKPDNLHREAGGTYIIAGMVDDEKACGGKRRLINGQVEVTNCHRGSVAVRLDPVTRAAAVVAHVEPDADFTGVASAAVVEGRVWFGTFDSDRIASVPVGQKP